MVDVSPEQSGAVHVVRELGSPNESFTATPVTATAIRTATTMAIIGAVGVALHFPAIRSGTVEVE
jgi:hypothetical protein